MAEPIITMKRYELKYVADGEKISKLKERLKGYMQIDKYGLTQIASLYYDTPDRRLIRESIEKPTFKEKIRLRSYGKADQNSTVFLELKRKAFGLVYKRRISTTQSDAENFLSNNGTIGDGGQIAKEIIYFRDYYKSLTPSCVIIYDREAYFQQDGDLRLTIDYNPRYRLKNLTLSDDMEGTPLLPKGYGIIEIKVQEAMPLWLTNILSECKIFKGNFSKYGEAYKKQVYNLQMKNKEMCYV